MGSSTYNAQVMEYNLNDTVMLTSVVLDRPQEYTLSFKPNGSGVMKLLISSLADASDVIGIYGLYTTVTTYTSQNITTTICNNGGDRYRFGFNGMEKDNELKGTGNSLDFGARMYDSRLGRFLSLDPLRTKYPGETNYGFASNMPISYIDIGGLEKYYAADGKYIGTYGASTVKMVVRDTEIPTLVSKLNSTHNESKYFASLNSNHDKSHQIYEYSGDGLMALVIQWHHAYRPKSINKEYSSSIYRMKIDGKLFVNYTYGEDGKSWPGRSSAANPPRGYSTIANIHSHPLSDGSTNPEIFSNVIFKNYDTRSAKYIDDFADYELCMYENIPFFISSPSGKIRLMIPQLDKEIPWQANRRIIYDEKLRNEGGPSNRLMNKWDKQLDKEIKGKEQSKKEKSGTNVQSLGLGR